MLETVVEFLNGAQGRDFFRLLNVVFLAFFTVAALAVLFAPSPKPGKVTYGMLRMLAGGGLLAVLVYQATWQLSGHTRADFVRFMRRYNKRPHAAEMQVMRGPILDRRGLVLAAPVPGDVWGRRYPLGEAAVHPLGYFHARYGITAVERVCDAELSGFAIEGRDEFPVKGLFAARQEEGASVTLTLDGRLQEKAYDLLAGRKGAVVVMRPQTGELLAMASSPGFDPSAPERAVQDEENAPAFNRATQGRYPPGSTFKILIAAMALEKKMSPVYPCPSMGYVAGPNTPPIRDSEYYAFQRKGAVWPGWGRLGLEEALTHSSNVYFAQLGVACGTSAFNEMMIRARINDALVYLNAPAGKLTSAGGNVPRVLQKRRLALLSIGQGDVLVTPLHVACLTSAVAAEGAMMRPRLRLSQPSEKVGILCRPETARQLTGMLRSVVRSGTGKAADIAGLEVCGKTGTSQVAGGDDHAWFTCFAPRRHAGVVVTVLIEHGGFGATAALPVARELLREADRLGYVRAWGSGKGGR